MKKTCIVLLLIVGLTSNLFAMTAAARKKHNSELRNNYQVHESIYIYTHRPMDVKVEIKKKELEKGVNSSTLTKLKWKRTHISTDDKLVTEKKATGKTFKTSKGDAFSDYYVELRVPYRRYLLTSDFVHELKQYDFKMEVAAVEFAVAVVAGVTAFFCPDAAQLSVKAAIAGTEDTIEAVKDFKPYRKNMEKANKHNYKLIHYYYKVTIEGHTAIISQSLIDYYKGSIFYDRETGTFTKGPKGRPTL